MIPTEGRMIRKTISNSDGYAKLSPNAAVLFCMIIPHLNSHGKMNGGLGYIKDEICPYVKYLSLRKLPKYMAEISKNTNIKWFKFDGRYWVHAVNFLTKHQKLNESRLGRDLLPSYSKLKRGNSKSSPPEVEVEEEREEEGEGEVKNTTPNPMRGGSRANISKGNGPRLIKGSIKEHLADVLKRNS